MMEMTLWNLIFTIIGAGLIGAAVCILLLAVVSRANEDIDDMEERP